MQTSRAWRRATTALACGLALSPSAVPAQALTQAPAQACPDRPTALVLSGGGVRGLAHIGVLKVLDSLGIRPDLVVGTSMGAVIGALYASGYRATEIDSIVRTRSLAGALQRFQARRFPALAGAQPLLVWSVGSGGVRLAGSPAQDPQINALIATLMLRGNLLARGDFDRLPIPFRAVATRLNDGRARSLRSGDLAHAVRASMAIPIVFDPVVIDGDRLVDGGLSANVPVAQARAAGATRVLVSDVTEGLMDTLTLTSPTRIAGHLASLLSTQPRDSLGPGDQYVRIDLTRYALLDFSSAIRASVIAEGQRAAVAVFDSATCLPRRSPHASRVPGVVGRVTVTGVRDGTTRELERMLRLQAGAALDLDGLRAGLLAFPLITRADAIWLSPSGERDTAHFTVAVEQQADVRVGMAVAYDHELGGRLLLGTVGSHRLGHRLAGSAVVSLDRFEQAAHVRLMRTRVWHDRPLSLVFEVGSDHQRLRTFDASGQERDAIGTRDMIGVLGVAWELGDGWDGAVGVEGRTWDEPARTDAGVGGLLRLTGSDANGVPHTQVEAAVTDAYLRMSAVSEWRGVPLARGVVAVRPFARYGWGKQLPLSSTFPLGGTEGFPGLHLGERRGSREVAGGLRVRGRLSGALVLETTGMGGTTAGEGGMWPDGDWLWGWRAGLGVETPVTRLRLEYGRNSLGRGAIVIRVGEWR